jgi:hypothetical protein
MFFWLASDRGQIAVQFFGIFPLLFLHLRLELYTQLTLRSLPIN